MRLLAVAPTAFYTDYGCHVRIAGQLKALQALGYNIHLLTYPAGKDVDNLAITRPAFPGMSSVPVGSSRRKYLLDAVLAPAVLATARRFRPHIIHCYLHEGALMGWLPARWLDVPLTFDYQGSLVGEMLDHGFIKTRSPALGLFRRLEKFINGLPATIFTSTRCSSHRLGANTSISRLVPLPDCVDPEVFRPQTADPTLITTLGLKAEQPTVVYLGLLAPYQGTDLLLRAIAHPLLAKVQAQFLIMGFPNIRRYQHMAQQLGISERVKFTGRISYSQAPKYLALGAVAVASKLSVTEGSGKLLPYMSMALPVVATKTPIHQEYLGDLATYAKHPATKDLAQALAVTLADLPARRREAARLRERVIDRHTWQHGAKTMHGTFCELLDRSLERHRRTLP